MYDIFESEVFFAPMLTDNQEVEIVGIHQASAFTFLPSYDINDFKSLIKK
ncbi:hypothetical protein IMCC3317_14000 [Kordia antarctica]|uniref:Uncharacterized protein n=1 Tax=Kordia antarctica TaxID=1218801 RepID=A0A7L4ZHV4_9FLAO|nr:hypothetical protein IMCC3317_14000 [Kordia antarctica]